MGGDVLYSLGKLEVVGYAVLQCSLAVGVGWQLHSKGSTTGGMFGAHGLIVSSLLLQIDVTGGGMVRKGAPAMSVHSQI